MIDKISIKAIRVNLEMSQEEMAKFLGITTRAYQDKENGINRFYFDEVSKICRKANISTENVRI